MRKSHYITILVAAALVAVLYWGVNTVPPKQPGEQQQAATPADAGQHTAVAPASVDSILSAGKAQLHEHAAEEIDALLAKVDASASKAEKVEVYKQVAQIWQEHKQMPQAAYYYTEAAKLDNSEKSLNFAARLNSELLRSAESPSVRAWAAQQAIAAYEQSLEVNPDNDTVKMALAGAYIDGTSQPMQGIQLLLGITREQPDHIQANLMLGQLSIRSGQMDKAQERFEKVLSIEPENTEALYFLAEVYKSKGNKQKAIELLEECKRIINNPTFSKEIDEYIKSFK
ncbi:MAG TPA: tetratricopeptide repeat protein [Flavipsychrobacter sp.]